MVEHTDEMVRQVDEQLLKIGRVKEGDLVVIIAGSPAGHPRLHQRAAHPPDGRRDQRGGAGVPPRVRPERPSTRRRRCDRRARSVMTSHADAVCAVGAPGGIRTHTGRCLRPLPLPLGLPGPCAAHTVPETVTSGPPLGKAEVIHYSYGDHTVDARRGRDAMWKPWQRGHAQQRAAPWQRPRGGDRAEPAARSSAPRSSCTSPDRTAPSRLGWPTGPPDATARLAAARRRRA